MYAVIETGGKQYKVAKGDVINVELMNVDADSEIVEIEEVLMVRSDKGLTVGAPYVKNAKVTAKFNGTAEDSVIKGKKVQSMNFRRRKSTKRKVGHRQKYSQITIEDIEV